MNIDYLACLQEITKIKSKYGISHQVDVLKQVGEYTVHQHFGGQLAVGSQEGYDHTDPKGVRRNAKARWLNKMQKNGIPKLSRQMKTGKGGLKNVDALTLILLCPDTAEIIGMYDFMIEDVKKTVTKDSYDNKFEVSTSKVWKYRKVIYER